MDTWCLSTRKPRQADIGIRRQQEIEQHQHNVDQGNLFLHSRARNNPSTYPTTHQDMHCFMQDIAG